MTQSGSHDKLLKKLVAATPCPKDHACITSGFQQMGEVDPAADGQVLFCRGESCRECPQQMSFGRTGLCRCPIRRYLAMHLDK